MDLAGNYTASGDTPATSALLTVAQPGDEVHEIPIRAEKLARTAPPRRIMGSALCQRIIPHHHLFQGEPTHAGAYRDRTD
jgi:hypothetical protein